MHRPHGKWSDPGVPHQGWRCFAVVDRGTRDHECQMCGKQHVRHVHHMEHHSYPETLGVGFACAAKMEGGDASSVRRQKAGLRKRKERAQRWVDSCSWQTRGDQEVRADLGYQSAVQPVDDGWRASVYRESDGTTWRSKALDARDEAKLAAFAHITGTDEFGNSIDTRAG